MCLSWPTLFCQQVAKLNIAYAKIAKKVDMKRLKTSMWQLLTKPCEEDKVSPCALISSIHGKIISWQISFCTCWLGKPTSLCCSYIPCCFSSFTSSSHFLPVRLPFQAESIPELCSPYCFLMWYKQGNLTKPFSKLYASPNELIANLPCDLCMVSLLIVLCPCVVLFSLCVVGLHFV